MTINDFLGQPISVGDYFAYAILAGRSANQAVYKLVSIGDDGKVKAMKIKASYGMNSFLRYSEWNGTDWVEVSAEKRAKIDAKTSTLAMVNERAILLKDFKE